MREISNCAKVLVLSGIIFTELPSPANELSVNKQQNTHNKMKALIERIRFIFG